MRTLTSRVTAASIDLGDLRVSALAMHEVMPGSIVHRPRGLEGYLIALFHGNVSIRSHGVERRHPAQSLVIWEPGESQRFGDASAPWEYSWVHCDGAFLHEALQRTAVPCNTVLQLADPSCFELFLQHVHRELTLFHTPNAILLHNAFQNVLVEIQRQVTGELPPQLPRWASELKQYLERHFTEPLSLAELAARPHFSVPHFCRQFKKVFGMTVLEYLTQIRMRMAKFLLLDDNLSIDEISRRIGYDSYSHFCALFKRCYGMSPRGMRSGMNGEAGRRQHAEARRSRELAYWLREGWQLVLESDFSHDTALDPRLRVCWHRDFTEPLCAAAHLAKIEHGCLRLFAYVYWTSLRWEGELTEELKVELVAVNHARDGMNLAIAISGDLLAGYRLRVLHVDDIALETVNNGYWQILSRAHVTLDPCAESFHLSCWRSENVFYAEIDGQRIIEYHEPFAPQGPAHRRFAIGSYFNHESADIRSLRVWRRIAPRYVDVLEIGRAFLRQGYRQDAFAWFRQIAEDYAATPLYHEALYLAALAVPDTERAAKEQALQHAAADRASPFHRRLLRLWVFSRLDWSDIDGAIDLALTVAGDFPDDDTPRLLADRILALLPRMPPAHYAEILRKLSRLPLTALRFSNLSLVALTPLAGMPLQDLSCVNCLLTDLSPLQGMPLIDLDIRLNAISDLAPLTGMPLQQLDCSGNRLGDLAPLQGLSLTYLNCFGNELADLSPLTGMTSLNTLMCDWNQFDNLTPLRGLSLQHLYCAGNRIEDLSPLRGMPLHELSCACNRIRDLTPLQDIPLESLLCGGNAITDLSPLSGLPLRVLHCGENPITSLLPLLGMQLEELFITGIPLPPRNLRVLRSLPLRHLVCDFDAEALTLVLAHPTLQGMNDHSVPYLRTIGECLCWALQAWKQRQMGHCTGELQTQAVVCDGMRYLAVPMSMSREEAESFSRCCGGTLACPATPEQFQQVTDYLSTVIYPSSEPHYHLGLTTDPVNGHYRWLSGAPYQWHNWRRLATEMSQQQPGIPVFVSSSTLEATFWEWDANAHARHCFVIEWQDTPAAPSASEGLDRMVEHTTYVATQVTPEVARLLRECRGTPSKRELMLALGLRNHKHFFTAYLTPALNSGYLERTIPDKHRSSKQHYRLTEKGIAWGKGDE